MIKAYTPSVLSTALQPMQVLLLCANAMRPPTFEVNTVLQRVWSPSARKENLIHDTWGCWVFFSNRFVLLAVVKYVLKLTEQDTLRFCLSQYRLKYSQQGLGKLLVQVILSVNGNVVLQHIDRILMSMYRNRLLQYIQYYCISKDTCTLLIQYRPLTSYMQPLLLLP